MIMTSGFDDQEVMHRDWMFKLVGAEHFTIGKARCCITIDAAEGFMYQYSLEVNGKTLEKFTENQSKIIRTWLCNVAGMSFRIVLGIIADFLLLDYSDILYINCDSMQFCYSLTVSNSLARLLCTVQIS